MSPRRKSNPQNGQPVLPFASTPDEIRRAVERGAIHRGSLLIKVIISQHIDEILDIVRTLDYDREDIHERYEELNIDELALAHLDNANPPIPYPFYFSTPDYFIAHPQLVMYYRNVAMLSRKVMRGIRLPTDAQEDRGIAPTRESAIELSRYFNGIISKLVAVADITPNRHLEIALTNIGDALGGISRNEVGRFAASQIIQFLVSYWHRLGYLKAVHYTLKQNFSVENEENNTNDEGPQVLNVTPETNITQFLTDAENHRVKFQEIVLRNGFRLLLDRQMFWKELTGEKVHRFGVDMISNSIQIDMVWGGEIKGGADPAGSDEHWKTATQALNRVIEAAHKSGRPKPQLSFLATILVNRVALEAQQWINEGKLTSVYNLTKIAESDSELQRFLNDMTRFLGYNDQ